MFIWRCKDGDTRTEMVKVTDTCKEKTLVFGRGGDSVSLDPAIVTDGESSK